MGFKLDHFWKLEMVPRAEVGRGRKGDGDGSAMDGDG